MTDPVIEVTAVGRAWAVPDQVLVSLGVEARDTTVGAALRAASTHVDMLMATLDDAGIPGSDRRTSGLRVEPTWDRAGNRENGHSASYELRVVTRDLDAAGSLVERAAERVGDALRVRQFALSVRDLRPHQEQARTRAVQACRAEAEQMAAAGGVRLGELLSLRTGDGGGPRLESLSAASFSSAGAMPVEPGEQEIAVVVTGTWRLAGSGATQV